MPKNTLTDLVEVLSAVVEQMDVKEPEPVEGCDICESLAKSREKARRVKDWSKVSDCNVEITRCPHAS